MAVHLETVMFALFFLFALFYLSIRIRKGARWLIRGGLLSAGILLTVLGALLLIFAYLVPKFSFLSFALESIELYLRGGIACAVLGTVLIILHHFYSAFKRGALLKLEEERRRYIERIRFGLTVDEAEKIAKEHIKKVTGQATNLVASKKEFKHWAIYLKDRKGKYYRVVINADGKIEEWQTMNEIPSYILSP